MIECAFYIELDLKVTKEDLSDLKKIIPKGPYCYSGSRNPNDNNYKPCPFWYLIGKDNAYGYCSYLGISDKTNNTHLWDQIKVCIINTSYDK